MAIEQNNQGGSVTSASGIASVDPMRLLRSYWLLFVVFGVLGVGTGVGTYFLLLRYMPQYTSTGVFQVRGAQQDVTDQGVFGVGGDKELEIAQRNYATRIISRVILEDVIDEPRVENTEFYASFSEGEGENKVFDDTKALQRLEKMVRASPIPDSSLVLFSVAADTPLDAQSIALSLWDALEDDVSKSSEDSRSSAVRTLNNEAAAARATIQGIENQQENLLRNAGITNQNIDSTESSMRVQIVSTELVNIRALIATTNETLQSYQSFRDDQGGESYPESVRQEARLSPIPQRFEADIAVLTTERDALSEDFGPNHPTIREIERRIRSMESRYERELSKAMSDIFEAQFQSLEQELANLRANEEKLLDDLAQAETELIDIQEVLERYERFEEERLTLKALADEYEAQAKAQDILSEVEFSNPVQIFQSAELPTTPSFPQPIVVVGGVTLFFLALSGGIAFLREATETRIRQPRDVMLIPKTRVLGFVPDLEMDPSRPKRAEFAAVDSPEGSYAEQIRQLRTIILDVAKKRGHQSILFASGLPGSGTSSMITNLASSFSAAESRVLILDANLRRPAIDSIFGLGASAGLSEVLLGSASLDDAIQNTNDPRVDVVAAGSASGRVYERFTTNAMTDLINEAKQKYDFVFVDTSPIVVSGDANALSARCDASVAIVRAMHEKRGLLTRLRNMLVASESEFLGVIVNGVRPSAGGYFKQNFEAAAAYSRRKTPVNPTPAKA